MKQALKYIKFVFGRNKTVFIFTMLFIALVQFSIVQFMSIIDMESMSKMMNSFPPSIKAMIGKDMLSRLSVEGSAAFAFTHPITFGMLSYLAISIPGREIAKSIEIGEMEMMLSYPISRTKVMLSIWLSGALMIAVVCLFAALSSVAALYIFHDIEVIVAIKMFKISLNLFSLFYFIFAFTTAIAVFSKEGSNVVTKAVAITGVSYLLMVLAQIWDKISWVKKINFFNYFDPYQVINSEGNFLWQVFDLSFVSLICFGFSIWWFRKRDV